MTQLNLDALQSSSLTPGLQDLGAIPDVVQTFSGTIPIGGSLSTTIPLNFSTNKVISLIKINVAGGNFGNYWFPLIGMLGLYDFGGSYYMFFTVQSSSSGRQINVQIINETVGSTVTLPTLTFTVQAHLYNYPW